MYKLNVILIFLFLIFSGKSFSQVLPNYPERAIVDSTYLINYTIQASDGAINPDEYIVGPGDRIFVSISGIEETLFNLTINQEGFVYIPKVGDVDLREKTLTEAKSLILDLLRKNFRNVDYYIALNDVRKIKVSLVGNVKQPSTQIITSNSRLLDLIKSSQGLTDSSDIRNIKVVSKNGTTRFFDFLKFLRLGDYSQNPYLVDGDVIIIDKIDKIITINGNVKYPANYEYKDGETLKDFIDLVGGLLYKARPDSIELIRFNEDGKTQSSTYYSYDFIQQNSIQLKNSDQIVVRELPEYYLPQYVTIAGKVKYPGVYKIIKNKTKLTEIIKEAGGFLEDASLVEATLNRTVDDESRTDPELERIKLIPRADMTDDEYDYYKSRSRQRSGKVVVDFRKLFRENVLSEDVVLRKGDIINVPEKKNYITLIGQIVNPGNIIYQPELAVKDYIELAGGFSWRALENDVRVVKANTGEWVDADEVEKLDPGDTIWVLENPPGPKFWEVFTTTLSVVGQIAAVIAATVAVIVATR